MFEGKCYYFSKEGKNWTSSQTFCSSYGASLARITTDEKNISSTWPINVAPWFMYILVNARCFWFITYKCCSTHLSYTGLFWSSKDFIMWLKGKTPYWIGLRRDRDQSWKWINGENATLEVIGNGGDCAYLTDDFKASSSRCNTEHSWICQRRVGAAGPAIEWKTDGAQLSRPRNPVDGIGAH
ncbi:C-type lectin domain family 2 member B-like [Pogona vitticeps]